MIMIYKLRYVKYQILLFMERVSHIYIYIYIYMCMSASFQWNLYS